MKTLRALLAFVILLIAGFPVAALAGYIFIDLSTIFLVPLGFPVIVNIWHAAGVLCALGIFKLGLAGDKTEHTEMWFTSGLGKLAGYSAALLVIWAYGHAYAYLMTNYQ